MEAAGIAVGCARLALLLSVVECTCDSVSSGRDTNNCGLSHVLEKMAGKNERSFIAVKPDGVQRGLVGEIVKRFEVKGFKLVAMKMIMVN